MLRYRKLRRILREIDAARARFEGTHYDIFEKIQGWFI